MTLTRTLPYLQDACGLAVLASNAPPQQKREVGRTYRALFQSLLLTPTLP